MYRSRGNSGGWRRGQGGKSSGSWRGGIRPPGPMAGDVERSSSPSSDTIVKTIRIQDLHNPAQGSSETSGITDCEAVASYSWLDESEPAILAPGKSPFLLPRILPLLGHARLPPAWTPPANAQRLKEDDGTYFRDPNAARYPIHPLEPAVRAIWETNPHFCTASIDIVACSSTLGSLLRFVRGDDKPFKLLLEAIGKTVFFERKENSPREIIPDVRGFGHTFPEAYTSWDPDSKGSVSHQRILGYTFAGFHCIVRSGVDGYLRGDPSMVSKEGVPPTAHASTTDFDDFSFSLAPSRLNASAFDAGDSLAVIAGGALVPQESLLEMKTRSFRKKNQDTVTEEMSRLWLTQISNFVLAYHEAGLFNDVRQIDVSQRVKEWEIDHQGILCKFSELLHEIVVLARSTNADRLELRWRESGILEVREAPMEVGQTLSARTEKRWRDLAEDASSGDDGPPEVAYEGHHSSYSEDEESEKDFTACSAEDCGYCGHCSY